MPRFGRVAFNINYVVDLDDADMVDEAKQCVFEDVINAVKYAEVVNYIKIVHDPAATVQDIPEFLRPPQDDNYADASST